MLVAYLVSDRFCIRHHFVRKRGDRTMGKLQTPRADAATEDSTGYRPALDAYARGLIARIQRDQSDTAAVLALKAHYEAHDDLPSLTNLMEGWARTLAEPDAAADAYVA